MVVVAAALGVRPPVVTAGGLASPGPSVLRKWGQPAGSGSVQACLALPVQEPRVAAPGRKARWLPQPPGPTRHLVAYSPVPPAARSTGLAQAWVPALAIRIRLSPIGPLCLAHAWPVVSPPGGRSSILHPRASVWAPLRGALWGRLAAAEWVRWQTPRKLAEVGLRICLAALYGLAFSFVAGQTVSVSYM